MGTPGGDMFVDGAQIVGSTWAASGATKRPAATKEAPRSALPETPAPPLSVPTPAATQDTPRKEEPASKEAKKEAKKDAPKETKKVEEAKEQTKETKIVAGAD